MLLNLAILSCAHDVLIISFYATREGADEEFRLNRVVATFRSILSLSSLTSPTKRSHVRIRLNSISNRKYLNEPGSIRKKMALSYTRLLCQQGSLGSRCAFQKLLAPSWSTSFAAKALPATTKACESYEEKNARLKRPLSPHLTIYQIQLTSLLSVTHRGTGIALATYAMALGLGTLLVPGGVPSIISGIEAWCMPLPILFLAKTTFAFPATFHYFNGIRHLLWDLGKFLTIKEVYSTGYVVLAAAAVTAIGLGAC